MRAGICSREKNSIVECVGSSNRFGFRNPRIVSSDKAVSTRNVPCDWHCTAAPAHDGESFAYALQNYTNGDVIYLSDGVYPLGKTWLATGENKTSLDIRGSSPGGRAILRRSDNADRVLIQSAGLSLSLTDVAVDNTDFKDSEFFYLFAGCNVSLTRVTTLNFTSALLCCGTGVSVRLRQCDLRDFASPRLLYVEDESSPVDIDSSNLFGTSPYNIHRKGGKTTRARQSPIEWPVSADTDAPAAQQLPAVLRAMGHGDIAVMQPGRYLIHELLWFPAAASITLRGGGGGGGDRAAVVIARAPAFTSERLFALQNDCQLTLDSLTVDNGESDKDICYAKAGARLTLSDCVVRATAGCLCVMSPNGCVDLQRCDFSAFRALRLMYGMPPTDGQAPAKLTHSGCDGGQLVFAAFVNGAQREVRLS